MKDVSIIITTFSRPNSLRICVESIRKFYPDIEIIVSDNGKPDSVLNSELVKVYKCRYLRLPFDCGNSHTKNAALDVISNKYAVILDDDFEFNENTKLEKFKTILDKDSTVGIVAGKPITRTGRVGTVGSRILINKEKEMFWRFPIENPEWKEIEGIKYYYADYVRQFSMVRNSPDIRYDDEIVVGAGHILFFINIKCHTNWKVAYAPEIEVVHHRASRGDKEYMHYRKRKNWKRKFYEKTGLRYGIFHGHTIYDYKNVEKIRPPDFERFEMFKPGGVKMHVDILIPTHDRLEPLKKCIKSIVDGDYKDISIFVIVDGNKKMIDGLKGEPIEILFNSERMDYVFSMNKAMKQTKGDAVIYASDDLIFQPNCICNAVRAMKEHFPDTDGLVVLKRDGKPERGAAFGLLGRKFINRFPDNAVFCPDYIHYGADSELWRATRYLERIYRCGEAVIDHSRSRDNTYMLAHEVKRHDKRIYSRRRQGRLLWGKNFERLGKQQ